MKVLILATCVCMAVAAPQRFRQVAAVAVSPAAVGATASAQTVPSFGTPVGQTTSFYAPVGAPVMKAASAYASSFGSPGVQTSSDYTTQIGAPVVKTASAYAASPVQQAASVYTSPVGTTGVKSFPSAAVKYNENDNVVPIIRLESDVRPDGFHYNSETGDGTVQEASGVLKQIGDTAAIVMQGSYRYVDPEGNTVEVVYTADENGFQPQSNILPVPPPVPEAIARSLEYIREHPYTEEVKH